jgi:hypothetical protein
VATRLTDAATSEVGAPVSWAQRYLAEAVSSPHITSARNADAPITHVIEDQVHLRRSKCIVERIVLLTRWETKIFADRGITEVNGAPTSHAIQ